MTDKATSPTLARLEAAGVIGIHNVHLLESLGLRVIHEVEYEVIREAAMAWVAVRVIHEGLDGPAELNHEKGGKNESDKEAGGN